MRTLYVIYKGSYDLYNQAYTYILQMITTLVMVSYHLYCINGQLAKDVLLISKMLLGYEEALWSNKLKISHVSQILTNDCQILVLSQISNYYCKSVKVFAFLHLWKSHVQNGKSDLTPKILSLWQAKSSRAKKKYGASIIC